MAQGTVLTSQIGKRKWARVMHQANTFPRFWLHFVGCTCVMHQANTFPRVCFYFVHWTGWPISKSLVLLYWLNSVKQWISWPVTQLTSEISDQGTNSHWTIDFYSREGVYWWYMLSYYYIIILLYYYISILLYYLILLFCHYNIIVYYCYCYLYYYYCYYYYHYYNSIILLCNNIIL